MSRSTQFPRKGLLPCLVSVLAVLLLPACSPQPGESEAAVCRNHLKELGILLKAYAAENSGEIPNRDNLEGWSMLGKEALQHLACPLLPDRRPTREKGNPYFYFSRRRPVPAGRKRNHRHRKTGAPEPHPATADAGRQRADAGAGTARARLCAYEIPPRGNRLLLPAAADRQGRTVGAAAAYAAERTANARRVPEIPFLRRVERAAARPSGRHDAEAPHLRSSVETDKRRAPGPETPRTPPQLTPPAPPAARRTPAPAPPSRESCRPPHRASGNRGSCRHSGPRRSERPPA